MILQGRFTVRLPGICHGLFSKGLPPLREVLGRLTVRLPGTSGSVKMTRSQASRA